MTTSIKIKKIGNSVGIILPKDLIDQLHLRENEEVYVRVAKKADISDTYGILKRTMSAQEFKDMVRK